jgi:hypothetical protein
MACWPCSIKQDRADRIGEPFAEHTDVVVFGSNGGGDLYAVAVTDGRVFRLQDASYIGGVTTAPTTASLS